MLTPSSVAEACEMVASAPLVVPKGGGTKWGLADPPAGARLLDMRRLTGMVEYEPSEFTVSALAGTPVAELKALLAQHGQALPFDPPFADQGATLGGMVAAGFSGPGRLRFGGVRDFVIGVRFIDGSGRLIRGGGKVVKNAAGFDLPKLFCGSRGRLGVLTEVTLKVFPRLAAHATLQLAFDRLSSAAAALRALVRSPLEPLAVDLLPEGFDHPLLLVRVGGPAEALDPWLDRIETLSGQVAAAAGGIGSPEGGDRRPLLARQRLRGEQEEALWAGLRDLQWVPDGAAVVRVHLTPTQIEAVDEVLASYGAKRRYSVGGNVAWAALPGFSRWEELGRRLREAGAAAVALRGSPPGGVYITRMTGAAFANRVKAALDPAGRFPAW